MTEILTRFTPTSFTSEPVQKESLDRIVDAGRLAPSAKNRQPWRFIVIQGEKTKTKILDPCYNEKIVEQAGAVIAICTTNIEYKMPNSHLSWPVDLSFAAAYMSLQAQKEGLGCVIYSTYQENEIKEILTVPHSMRILLLLLIGYTAETKEDPPERLKRDRTVSEEHW